MELLLNSKVQDKVSTKKSDNAFVKVIKTIMIVIVMRSSSVSNGTDKKNYHHKWRTYLIYGFH